MKWISRVYLLEDESELINLKLQEDEKLYEVNRKDNLIFLMVRPKNE